ncbi:FEZ-like protein [Trichuris suis]|nr:FEZ-like protein [Trichuris suis]
MNDQLESSSLKDKGDVPKSIELIYSACASSIELIDVDRVVADYNLYVLCSHRSNGSFSFDNPQIWYSIIDQQFKRMLDQIFTGIWWTLTGNFGNILPLDWSKSQTRSLQLSALNLLPETKLKRKGAESGTSEEDEDLPYSMDLHDMIVSSFSPCDALPQTADQVIEEIDEIMQQSNISEVTGSSDVTMDSVDSMYTPKATTVAVLNGSTTPVLPSVVQADCLSCIRESHESLELLSYKKLLVLHSELETLIQVFNENLVQELALRDEYEFEKELKNTFISLLLSIQQKRRLWHNDCKRRSTKGCKSPGHDEPQPQFLTACIPYREDQGIPDNASFQALIKIMRAINDDSATVPSLLTDYILKGTY